MASSSVQQLTSNNTDEDLIAAKGLPVGVDVFEINGPLFFGAAYKFKDAMKIIKNPAKILIIRMNNVPIIDATGLRVLKEVHNDIKKSGTKLILSEVTNDSVMSELQNTRLLFQIGKSNVTETFEQAVKRAQEVLSE